MTTFLWTYLAVVVLHIIGQVVALVCEDGGSTVVFLRAVAIVGSSTMLTWAIVLLTKAYA